MQRGGSDILVKAILFQGRTIINLIEGRQFLRRGWINFDQEGRDFLCAQKEISEEMCSPIKKNSLPISRCVCVIQLLVILG